ncbi:5'-nucleotidase C-terminal domain-containing protein [Pedobacter nyackensis]|uniref:5'-nucleotidase C-terminal domain-containing protein n=1 Tax=Pedobacter nyackensis TaxID=475255 RepID=UPI00292D85CA|nr:5'-nucleotidase C-terminal domain-containing protein [Pedobacter nyackensis]
MVKYIRYSFKGSLAILAFSLLLSCSSGYKVVKANRAEYAIDKTIAADSAVIKTYLPYKQQLDSEMNQVLGYSEVAMVKSNDLPETVLGNFFSDAVLQQALKYDPTIDFSMPSTKGGIRVDVPKGAIKLSNIFELMPFENELVAFTIKGADVQELINFIAASNGQPVAGIRLKIVDKKPVDVFIQGKPFDPQRTYRVLTSDYVAGGGDNALGFKNPIEKKVLGLKVRDAIIGYVKEVQAAGKTINTKLDGRITKN